MRSLLLRVLLCVGVGVLAGSPLMGVGIARAEAPPIVSSSSAPDSVRVAALEKQVGARAAAIAQAQTAGDNSWMLTSAALVLLMTGPGLALFYGGLVRKKNVLGTMMQSFILMAVITVVWAIVGYSLVFAEGSPVLGDLRYALLRGVGAAPNPDYA